MSATVALLVSLVSACRDDVAMTDAMSDTDVGSDETTSSTPPTTGASTDTGRPDTSATWDTSMDDTSTTGTGAADVGETDADTDATTGEPPQARDGQSMSQLVTAGTRSSSANHSVVFTVGQPSKLQSTHDSANYRLRGGLIGANGSPP